MPRWDALVISVEDFFCLQGSGQPGPRNYAQIDPEYHPIWTRTALSEVHGVVYKAIKNPEGPSTQRLQCLIPKTITGKGFGNRSHKY